jgi:hypothetical protein
MVLGCFDLLLAEHGQVLICNAFDYDSFIKTT